MDVWMFGQKAFLNYVFPNNVQEVHNLIKRMKALKANLTAVVYWLINDTLVVQRRTPANHNKHLLVSVYFWLTDLEDHSAVSV